MSSRKTRRLRNALLVALTGGALAVSSCQEGGQGVTTVKACHSGALFECANPHQFDA
jgi:hypothetical protein